MQSNDTNKSAPHCLDSQSKCVINSQFGKIHVLFNVKEVLTEQPFSIDVGGFNSVDKVTVSAHLEGKNMYMGRIPLFFEQQDTSSLRATTLLGSCTQKQMRWQIVLKILSNDNKKIVEQHFIEFSSLRS